MEKSIKKGIKYQIHKFKRQFKPIIEITDICVGCSKCARVCPIPDCIIKGTTYKIDKELCMRCGKCIESCPVEAIVRLKK